MLKFIFFFIISACTANVSDFKVYSEPEDEFTKFIYPVDPVNAKITSKFGRRGFSFHDGVDFAAPEGTPILAVQTGKVVYSGSGFKSYGNIIIVQHNHIYSVYAHNQRNLVQKGDIVYQGQNIANVGSTGNATGPHLHFEVRVITDKGIVAVDPSPFF